MVTEILNRSKSIKSISLNKIYNTNGNVRRNSQRRFRCEHNNRAEKFVYKFQANQRKRF